MKRTMHFWLVISVLTTLVISPVLPPGSQRSNVASASSQQTVGATSHDAFIDEPTSYDRLHHGSPSTPWTAFAGRGVNSIFGNLVLQSRDLVVQGRGMAVSFLRTYNSANQEDGPLGKGWTHSYNTAIINQTTDSVTVRNPDGRLNLFARQADGSYTAPPGVYDRLTRNADGSAELKLKNQVVYHFDASGELAAIHDSNGNAISLTYANGDLSSLTDTVGRSYAFTYDANHHLTKITDPSSREVAFAYNPSGLLASVTDLAGQTTHYTYDAGQRLSAVTDANNHTPLQITYDGDSRVVQQSDALNNATTFAYQPSVGQTTVTDPRGASTLYSYDAGFRVTSVRDAFSKSLSFTHDSRNNRIAITDRRGNVTSLTYDDRGNVTQAIDAANGVSLFTYDAQNNLLTTRDARQNPTTLSYDANGNLLAVVDALGYTTGFAYDGHGQVTNITDANGNVTEPTYDSGNIIAVTNALNYATQFIYDDIGRMTGMIDAANGSFTLDYDLADRPTEVVDAAGGVTRFTYDAVGNRLSVTDALTRTTQFTYDARNQLVTVTDADGGITRYGYDANGNRISVQDPANQTTTSAFDLLDRLVAVTDPLGNTTEYGYDANGNRTVITDTLGMVTTFGYDPLNRLTSTTDPLGHTTTMEYDAVGNLLRQTDAMGRATRYTYDALGRLKTVTDPANNTVRYYYDRVGNRTEVVDAKNVATHYVYDQVNRLVLTEDPLGNRTEYTYDKVGNLTEKTDPNGQTTTYTYDALKRLAQVRYPDNALSYDYDKVGNRTHVIDIQGVTRYEYDELNRISRVTNPANQSIGYTYDALGRRTSLIYPDNRAVSYSYDDASHLISVRDWDNQTTHYAYNDRGQVSTVNYPNGATISYSYDNAGRLTDIMHRDAANQIILPIHYTLDANGNRTAMTDDRGVEQYTYDTLDRLTQVNYADGEVVSYTYDGAGNRLSMQSSVHGTTSYTYDEGDRLLQMVNPDNSVTEFAYDANGNMTRKGDVQYLFDSANRLTQVIDGENVVLFTYDGDGHRLTKVVNGVTSQYATDLASALPQVLTETREGEATAYTYGLGLNSLAEPERGWRYYHADGLGSVRSLYSSSNQIASSYEYDVFGLLREESGTSNNSRTFTGQQFDHEPALFYLRARYYDPSIGRFISADPLLSRTDNLVAANAYTYADNSPVVLVDPEGLQATSSLYCMDTSAGYSEVMLSSGCLSRSSPGENLGTDNLNTQILPHENPWMASSAIQRGADRQATLEYFAYGKTQGNPDSAKARAAEKTTCGIGEVLDFTRAGQLINTGCALNSPLSIALFVGSLFVPKKYEYLAKAAAMIVENSAEVVAGLLEEPLPERMLYIPPEDANSPLYYLGCPEGVAGVSCRQVGVQLYGGYMSQLDTNQGLLSLSGPNLRLNAGRISLGPVSRPNLRLNAGRISLGPVRIKTDGTSQGGLQIASPTMNMTVQTSRILVQARTGRDVRFVSFHAYYATNPADITTVAWHDLGWAQRVGDTWVLDWDLATVPDQGNAGWGTVAISAHYYTCNDPANPSCEHVGDQVRVDIDRGPLTWDFTNDSLGWTLVNGDHEGFDGRAWKFEPGNDPQAVSPAMAVDASKYNAVEVVMDSTASNSAGRIYFTTQASPTYTQTRSVEYTLVPNGDYRSYLVYMGANSEWQGIVTGLRVDPVMDGDPASGSDYVFLDKISFRQLDGASRTTWVPDGSLVRNADETIYLIEQVNGVSLKRPFSKADVFLSCGYDWNKILYLSETQLASYNDGPIMTACTGAILKGSGPTVYFVENGSKRPFCSGDVYTNMGYRWDDVQIVADSTLEAIPDGQPLCTGWTRHPDGSLVKTTSAPTVYLLQGSAKRGVADPTVLSSWGRSIDEVITISDAEMATYAAATDLPIRDGALIKGSDPTVYVVEAGKRRPFVLAADFEAFGYRWETVQTIPDAVLNAIPSAERITPDPLVVTTGLTVTPDWPAVGQSTTAAFTVKNTSNKPVALQGLRAEVPTVGAFPVQTATTLQPGQAASYSKSRTFSATGTYQARAQVQLNGAWQSVLPDIGQSTEAGFTVMMIAAPSLNPIQNSDQDGSYQVSWSAVSGATLYRLMEDDDPNFGSPQVVYEASGTSWSVTGHVAGSFHYRVKVMLPYVSGLSGPQSVIVQGTPVYHGWHPDGTLLQIAGGSEVMLLESGLRRRFPNSSIYYSHYPDWRPVGIAQPIEYNQYDEGARMTFRAGTVVMDPANSTVYAIENDANGNNAKRGFCNAKTYLSLGYSWDAIQRVPASDLPTANGAIICINSLRPNLSLVKSTNSLTVYRIENGQKRPFSSANSFLSYGHDWDQIAVLDDVDLNAWTDGSILPIRDGTVITCEELSCYGGPGTYWIMENGLRRGFTTEASFLGQGYHWDQKMVIPASEFNAITQGAVMTDASYPVQNAFVKYDFDSTVYRVINGQKWPVTHEDILRSYGYLMDQGRIFIAELHCGPNEPCYYWRLMDLPTGPYLGFRDGTLVKSPSTGAIYTTQAGQKQQFVSSEALVALGYDPNTAMSVADSLLNALPNGSPISLRSLLVEGSRFRQTNGTIWRLENGQKRGFPTWEVYYSWGYQGSSFANLPDAEANSIPSGSTINFRNGSLLKEQSNQTVYVVVAGQKRPFPSMQVMEEYGYNPAAIQVVPDGQLAGITTGPVMEVGSPTPLSAVINGGAQYTTSPDVTVRVHATDFSSGVRYVHLSNDNWTTTHVRDLPPAEGDFTRDIPWNLTTNAPGDGLKKVWVKFCDVQNYCTANNGLQPAQIILNTTPPSGAYTAPAAGQLVRDQVALAASVTDNGSGIQYVEFKAQYSGAWRTLHKDYIAPYEFTWDVTGVPDDDQIVLGGNVVDNMGRTGAITTRTISKDRTPPASTGVTASDETSVQRAAKSTDPAAVDAIHPSSEFVRDTVTLMLDAEDNQSGVGTVQFSGYYAGTWHAVGSDSTQPYELTWNMTGVPDGPVSVKATVPDVAGNSQDLPAVQFVKDTVVPTEVTTIRLAGQPGAFTNDTTPEFVWTAASDDRSGIDGYFLAIDDWTPDGSGALDWTIASVATWSPSEPLASGSHWVALTSRDRAGNVNPADTNQQGDAPFFEFTIDLVAPASAVEPLAAQQTTPFFPVTWAGSDDVAGVATYDIQFKEDSGPWLNWLVGTTQTGATFRGEPGRQYAFRSRAYDAAGNLEAYPSHADATTVTLPPSPLPVTLESFEATAQVGHVLVTWQTTSEISSSGFNLYRGTDPASPEGLLQFLPSQAPGSSQGFAYEWIDSDVVSGQTYYYWLEDINLNGTTTLHGPVSATVNAPTAVTISDLHSSSQSAGGWLAELITAVKAFLTTALFR